MTDFVEQLSFIVPALSITFVVIITSINAYLNLRKRFPASVNCWFCNGKSKVPYMQSNSWECPYCDQYNGFAEDGGYNCEIPAQYNAKLNVRKITQTHRKKSPILFPSSNGLCSICNRNQEIKIQQLASFEPEILDNYDEEFELFRKKLEEVHRLCPTCERHLRRTLNKVKKNVLGSKLSQIGSRGLHLFDLHMSNTNKQCILQRKHTFTKLIWLTLIALAILKLISIGQNIHISKVALDSVCHPIVTHIILVASALISSVKLYLVSIFSYLKDLQVFSQLFGGISYTLVMIYTTITGSLIFSQFYSSLLVWYSDSGSEIVMEQTEYIFRSYDQDFTICLAAVILSLFIVWIGGTKRAGPIVVLLLWSFAMMLPLWETNPSFIAGGQVYAILLDLFKILIGISSLAAPIVSSVKMAVAKGRDVQANSNSSFHRIYPEYNSEASDESDSETVFSSSIRSFRSNCPSPQRPESVLHSSQELNRSLDSTKSWSPSALRPNKSSLPSLNNSITDKQSLVLNASFGRTTKRNLLDNHQNGFHTFNIKHAQPLSSSQSMFNRQFAGDLASHKSMSMTSLNRRAPFYDVPDEFQNEITGLNISDCIYKQAPSNGFVASTSESQLRQRRNLICPSRLTSATISPALQSSWVAGGYWNNNTSPQKQKGLTEATGGVPLSLQLPELYPMMSRTSSQSSGFESQASSVHNMGAPLADRDSRESSVCAAELASVFSSDNIQPSDSVSQCGVGDEQFLHHPQLVYTAIASASQTFIRPSVDTYSKSGSVMNLNSPSNPNVARLSATSHQSSSSLLSPVTYHQFGTQRVQNSRTYNFNKLTNNLPVIQSGSLLKSWRDRSMQQLSTGQES